jgi:RNA polymerase sigma-32 factor
MEAGSSPGLQRPPHRAEDPRTLAELAQEFGISRERARQIEVNSFEKVQKAVKHRVAVLETPGPLPAH